MNLLDDTIPDSYLGDVCGQSRTFDSRGMPSEIISPDPTQIISSSKIYGWGGARPNSGGARANSGGPRPNSGGARPNTGGARPGAGRPRKDPIPRNELPAPEISGVRWYCFETHPGMAFVAEEELAFAGFETALPRERIEVIRHKAHKERREVIVRPLLGRYGFVKLDMGGIWMPAAYALGVKRLFGRSSERPTPVRVGEVERLLARMDKDGVVISGPGIRPVHVALEPIERDATVKLLDGPFVDWAGVCEMSLPDRVTVLIDIMGGKRRVTVPRSAVRVVEGEK